MKDIIQAAALAQRMTDARESLRTLLGDGYGPHIARYREVLREVMTARGLDALRAVLSIKEHADPTPMETIKLLAAALDEMEAETP